MPELLQCRISIVIDLGGWDYRPPLIAPPNLQELTHPWQGGACDLIVGARKPLLRF